MQIRQEMAGDEESIGEVHAEAFSVTDNPEAVPPEVGLVEALRASPAWIPALSLVAIENEQIVGHVTCTRAHVDGIPVLGLGPIGIRVVRQNHGVGTALMRAVISAADERGEPLIGLLGSTSYYSRFGFVPSSQVGISSPDPSWGDHFQTLRLVVYREDITERFSYAEPFKRV
ncbi:MAG: N-acetyltransferase [Acidimicrobiia bacterium]